MTKKRQALLAAQKALSSDGRLVLAALSDNGDRPIDRHNIRVKSELPAFVVSDLSKKERAKRLIVLSAEQKQAARILEPAPSMPSAPMRSGMVPSARTRGSPSHPASVNPRTRMAHRADHVRRLPNEVAGEDTKLRADFGAYALLTASSPKFAATQVPAAGPVP
jgi:hypothetical protein